VGNLLHNIWATSFLNLFLCLSVLFYNIPASPSPHLPFKTTSELSSVTTLATPNAKRGGAREAWKHDYKLADTKLASLNTMRSNLVKELVKSDASQVLVDRRQRLEEGVTALRVAELLKKVEAVRKRIEGSLTRSRK
jgi:hypothetical protein